MLERSVEVEAATIINNFRRRVDVRVHTNDFDEVQELLRCYSAIDGVHGAEGVLIERERLR